ncbi:hypothetical protein GIB67_011230 [Kingdonia uniflora]|uniref:R13L1/DRL21-like LRR repeat region domain-containing protein n=1 Tax=Kingdonia uniflora TaxID=39325 RepID=A0A7J7M3Z9_9MAGN|nr:hypothetical protein GIB67_011230 [Kingdonia uniflora]
MRDLLEPHPNLKELEIYSYNGSKFPSWMEFLLDFPSIPALLFWFTSTHDNRSYRLNREEVPLGGYNTETIPLRYAANPREDSTQEQVIFKEQEKSGNVRSHILRISKLVLTLKELGLTIDDTMMVHLAVWSLPQSFEMFQVHYQNQEKTWEMNELIAALVSKEERHKKGNTELAHLTTSMKHFSINSQGKKKFKNQGFTKNNGSHFGLGQSFRSGNGNGNGKQNVPSSATTLSTIECFFYKKKSHVKQDCHSYKNWLNNKKRGVHLAGNQEGSSPFKEDKRLQIGL